MKKKLRLAYLTLRYRYRAYRNPRSPRFGRFTTPRSSGCYLFGVTFQKFDNFGDYFFYPLNNCRSIFGRPVTHVPVEISRFNNRTVWFTLPDGNRVNCKMSRVRYGFRGELPR